MKLYWKPVILMVLSLMAIAVLVVLMQFIAVLPAAFNTRGDQQAIVAAATVYWTSWFLRIAIWVLLGGISFWWGNQMRKMPAGASMMNALVGAGVGTLFCPVMYQPIILEGFWPYLVGLALALGGAYLGVTMGKK